MPMNWFKKNEPKQPVRKAEPHFKKILSMKPPHDEIDRQVCHCYIGKDHSEYGTAE